MLYQENWDKGMHCGQFTCSCARGSEAHPASWKWIFGILCAVGGSVGAAAGLVMQKLAHNENELVEDPEQRHKNYFGMQLTNSKWLLGFCLLTIVPAPLALAAVALAPQSIIAPLSAVTVVFCQVLAPLILGERVTCRDWFATFMIVVGCAASSLFGDHCSHTFSIAEIKLLFSGTRFLIFEGVIVFLLIISYSIMCLNWVKDAKIQTIVTACLHAMLAGTLAGQQNILFKATGEQFSRIFQGHTEVWNDWFLYFSGVTCILIAVIQMMHLNKGMQLMDAVKYLPIYSASMIINSTLSGLIFYKEYLQMTNLGLMISTLCWCIIVFGVVMLACGASEQPALSNQLKAYLPDGVAARRQPRNEDAMKKLHASEGLHTGGEETDALLGT